MAKRYYTSVVVQFSNADMVEHLAVKALTDLQKIDDNLIVITNEPPQDCLGAPFKRGCGYVNECGKMVALVGEYRSLKSAIVYTKKAYPSAKKFNHVDGTMLNGVLVVECYKSESSNAKP